MYSILILIFFFFSSRRRHTRWTGDWSSTCALPIWAEDFDVEAVGVMPPVVEGRGSNHRDGAPGAEKRAERAAESPHGNGIGAKRGILAESGGENEIAAAEAGKNATELDQDVGRSPESVAADAFVTGDVPDAADNAASDGEEIAPDIPGDRKGASGDALSGASRES